MKRKNTEQTPTPETDAVAFDAFDGQGGEVVFADLARRFERERNKAEAGWLECRNFAQQMVDERDEALKVIASFKKQLRRLASKREMPDPRPFYDRCEEAAK